MLVSHPLSEIFNANSKQFYFEMPENGAGERKESVFRKTAQMFGLGKSEGRWNARNGGYILLPQL
jgi:hypothetical protein